jgi:hypothetical protein
MADVKMTTQEKVSFTIAPATPNGTPGPIEGTAKHEVLSGTSTVEWNADGQSGFIVSANAPEIGQIKFSVDADLDPGVTREVSEILNVTITDPQVTTLGFNLGTPEPK